MTNFEGTFRGKRLDNDEWIYGSYISIGDRKFIAGPKAKLYDIYKMISSDPGSNGTFAKIRDVSEIYKDTPCLCTSVKDSKGTKIFEFDIVLANETIGGFTVPRIGIVFWNKEFAMFVIRFFDGRADCFLSHRLASVTPTVIGNRFDNLEMIPEQYRFWEEDYE